MRILLSGPGTGKTTRIKTIIDDEFSTAKNITVLSFTNFTVRSLVEKFGKPEYANVHCSTLHTFALKLNHLSDYHILSNGEDKLLEKLASQLGCDFEALCGVLKCITFEGMISECASFIRDNPTYAPKKLGAIDLLLVDEYQDFNAAEQELIDELSKLAGETIILGDDDQSIYGFKDADPDRIISIYNDNNVTKIDHEHKCWRCPDEVVEGATRVIENNKNRIAKNWYKTGVAGTVSFQQVVNLGETNNDILKRVRTLKATNTTDTILVLSPLGVIVTELKKELIDDGVEVNDCWPEKLDAKVHEGIWWLNSIYLDEIKPSIVFLLNKVTGSKKSLARALIKDIIEQGLSRTELVARIRDGQLLPDPFRSYLENAPTLEEFFRTHTEFANFELHIDKTDLSQSLRKLATTVNPTKELQKGLVNLMSIHKSKGLEADHVFITGLVKGILPNNSSGLDTIEAQRRLLFVAMTRALKGLYLYSIVEWSSSMLISNFADMKQFEFRGKKKCIGKTSGFVSEMRKKSE